MRNAFLRLRLDRLVVLLLALLAVAALAAGFESLGPLRTDHYLAAAQLAGPDWKVEPEATTDGFATTYTVTSRFGSWPARGRVQVASRIREIQALAQLEEVQKSDVFKDAVKNSVTAPVQLVSAVIDKPAETLKGIPSGVGRWVKKTNFQIKEGYHDAKELTSKDEEGEGEKKESDKSTKEQAQKAALDYLKISKAELNWYAKLGVDPYTDNQLLRRAVTSVARVEGLTNFGMRFVALPGIPGAGEIRRTMDVVWKTDPWELRLQNRKKLLAAGLTEQTARAFEDNPFMSLSQQTILVTALDQLAGVDGREHLIARGIDVESREEGADLVSSIALMLRFHRQMNPLKAFLPGARMPVALAVNGDLVAVALTDAIFWTSDVAEAARAFAGLYASQPTKTRRLWVVGEASPAFKSGARELDWEVRDRWQIAAPQDAEQAAK